MINKLYVILCIVLISLVAGCASDEESRSKSAQESRSLKDTNVKKTARAKRKTQYAQRKFSWKRVAYRSRSAQKSSLPKAVHGQKKTAQVQTKTGPGVSSLDEQVKDQTSGSQDNALEDSTSDIQPSNEVAAQTKQVVTDLQTSDQSQVKQPQTDVAKKDSDVSADAAKREVLVTSDGNKVASEVQENAPKRGVPDALDSKPAPHDKSSQIAQFRKSQDLPKANIVNGPPPKGRTRSFKVDASPNSEGQNAYSDVKVYYATDRNITGRSRPNKYYGAKRSDITYGICEISIPKNHKTGVIETPSVWRLEFTEEPERHVSLLNIKRENKSRFFSDMKKQIDLSVGKNAFLFVHGYNVEFHEAAKRTAQMAFDLGFDGAPVFYSWPSKGNLTDYPKDEATIEWTQRNLKHFVRDFALRSDAENIYLIAHSMGSRALTKAVAELVTEMPSLKKRFKEIMLAAPDIDSDVFKRDIAPKLVEASKNVTLYAAADDRALQISKTLHGVPRAGDAGRNLVVVDGIDTIDATGVDASFFRHTYFSDAPTVLADIIAIIKYNLRPQARKNLLSMQGLKGRRYWAFRRSAPVLMINGDPSALENGVREVVH